MYKGILTLRK